MDRVEPVAGQLGLRLIDLEYLPSGEHSILRLFLDRDGGVGLDDLARASQEIETVIDAYELVPGSYRLECSSPGINRRLRGRADFLAHRGLQVRLRTTEPVSGSQNFLGTLIEVTENVVQLGCESGVVEEIPFELIERANYEHNFERDSRVGRAGRA